MTLMGAGGSARRCSRPFFFAALGIFQPVRPGCWGKPEWVAVVLPGRVEVMPGMVAPVLTEVVVSRYFQVEFLSICV